MNLQTTYFDIIPFEDNPFISDEALLRTRSQILNRRKCIKHYSELLQLYRPILFEHLITIYYHPEITILMQIIIDHPSPRKFHMILRKILTRNIQSQFPYGDNHVQLMESFIDSISPSSIQFMEF